LTPLLFLSLFISSFADTSAVDASARFVWAGTVGTDLLQSTVCYIISAEYQTQPQNVSADIFAAAMGYNIAGVRYPWTAVGYVHGSANVDLNSYTSRPDQVNVDAAGAVVAWAFTDLVEFCDLNGVEGYQKGTTDTVINIIPGSIALWSSSCGTFTEPQTGLPAYFGSVQSLGANFNTTCLVFPSDTGSKKLGPIGRSVSRYDFKCGVTLDMTGLWNTTSSCSDGNRKVGLVLSIAAASFDLDVTVANLNGANPDSPDGNSVSFGGGKLIYKWDNFHTSPAAHGQITGARGVVVAEYFGVGNTTYNGAATVNQVIFSFSTPKSSGKDLYYWDPTIEAVPTSSGVSIIVSFTTLFFAVFHLLF